MQKAQQEGWKAKQKTKLSMQSVRIYFSKHAAETRWTRALVQILL